MVSPPLPMMRPAFPAGMIISCMFPLPLVDSWKEGGVPRPRETMSSSSILAFLHRQIKRSTTYRLTLQIKNVNKPKRTGWLQGLRWETRSSLEDHRCLKDTTPTNSVTSRTFKQQISGKTNRGKKWTEFEQMCPLDSSEPVFDSPGAIWTLQPDSCWILLICSPPRPMTTNRHTHHLLTA